jgi:hypothetical protein
MKKQIIERVKINHDLNASEVRKKAMRVFLDFEEEADRFQHHYVYLNGETVSDLIIIYYNKGWRTRRCSDKEWISFFNKHLYEKRQDSYFDKIRSKGKA